jgi:hypothetical protein
LDLCGPPTLNRKAGKALSAVSTTGGVFKKRYGGLLEGEDVG